MKYYCTECGHQVPLKFDPVQKSWTPGRCKAHPSAKRMSDKYIKRRFDAMRAAVLGAVSALSATHRAERGAA